MKQLSAQYNTLIRKNSWKFFAACIFISLMSWLVFALQYQTQVTNIKLLQDNKILNAHNILSKELGDVKKLVRLLAFDQSLMSQSEGLPNALQEKRIIRHFVDFGLAAKTISQIRWIDKRGKEQYRVNFSNGSHHVVDPAFLQNKRSRYYFQQGINSPSDTVYLSPIDLNVEQAQIVLPFEPTLRASIRTLPTNFLLDGILVVNFDLTAIFKTLRAQSIPQAQIKLVNNEGFWLIHPEREKEWSFMLGGPPFSLEDEYPKLMKKIERSPESNYVSDETLLRFLKVSLIDSDSPVNKTQNNIFIIVSAQKYLLEEIVNTSLLAALVCAVILLLIAGVYLYRSYRYQCKIVKGSYSLSQEKHALSVANKKLYSYVKQQEQLQDELVDEKKLSSLGLMVSGLSHEMNTPLGGAAISISVAQSITRKLNNKIEQGLTKKMLEDNINDIDENLALSRLNVDKAIAQLKGFKSMAHDRADDQLVKCNLHNIVEDLLRGLNSRFKTSKITISYTVEVKQKVISRPGIISQVIEGLIVNALSHAFEEGQKGSVKLAVFDMPNNKLCITVSDDGVGIDESMLGTLFEPFVTSSRGDGHTGLGLYLIHQWVTNILQGNVRLLTKHELDDEMTTQFKIILPARIEVI